MNDFFKFALAALRQPAAVGTLFPATQYLAAEMVRGVKFKDTDYIVELGPGTGPITKAIDELLVKKDRFVGIDLHQDLIPILRTNFPHLRFEQGSAEHISTFMPSDQKATYVFSSLPWAIFPLDLQNRIMAEIAKVLAPDGKLIAYGCSHGLLSPTSIHFQNQMRKHFKSVNRSSPVWLNIPPASVFRAEQFQK
jgi:phosphatidylethanolamine/phosphatidyl-N-methylethanolamine N-methyltransferase